MSRWTRESWEQPPLVEVTDEDGSKRLCGASVLPTSPCETLNELNEACRIVQQRLIDHESVGMLASATVCVHELWDAAVKMDRAAPIPTRPRFPKIDCDKPTPKALVNDVIESLNLLRDWAFAEKKAQTGTGGPGEGEQADNAAHEVPPGESATGADTKQTPKPEIKRPSENAFKAWRLRDLSGTKTQAELAEKMTENGIPADQGQVSKWLKQVGVYMAAGGVLPELPKIPGVGVVDPHVIDMGERQDGLTPHQRERWDADS